MRVLAAMVDVHGISDLELSLVAISLACYRANFSPRTKIGEK